ncbi:hypothetical protein BDZ89DRAFT_1048558 [Hymenopellis radicata]|nr:hypothetical protein BDZ89DRAFT_1048558 [Hymenopellis radicata]
MFGRDSDSTRLVRPGMEYGYDNSNMAGIEGDYTTGETLWGSTESRVLDLSRRHLRVQDYQDRGFSRNPKEGRFILEEDLKGQVDVTVTELQKFLLDAAQKIDERTEQRCYIIDPDSVFVDLLCYNSTNDFALSHAAWQALRRRLAMGHCEQLCDQAQRRELPNWDMPAVRLRDPICELTVETLQYFHKYIEQFKWGLNSNSPTSTNPDLYRDFNSANSPSSKIQALYSNIPHHQEQLSSPDPYGHLAKMKDRGGAIPKKTGLAREAPSSGSDLSPAKGQEGYSHALLSPKRPTISEPDISSVYVTATLSPLKRSPAKMPDTSERSVRFIDPFETEDSNAEDSFQIRAKGKEKSNLDKPTPLHSPILQMFPSINTNNPTTPSYSSNPPSYPDLSSNTNTNTSWTKPGVSMFGTVPSSSSLSLRLVHLEQ